jgi:ABC-type uncharacterized transport system YnjBCD ATPase subunit
MQEESGKGRSFPYLGSYNSVHAFVLQRPHVGGQTILNTDAFEVLVLQDVAHIGMRLNGNNLVPLISVGQELSELAGARRKVHDCGLRAVGDAYAVEQDRDAVGGERRAMLVIQGGIAEPVLRRGVDASWSRRHDDLCMYKRTISRICSEKRAQALIAMSR